MKSLRYSNRIKILSWANRPEIGPYEIPRKGSMDIRFKFSVGDLNFEFLSLLLRSMGRWRPWCCLSPYWACARSVTITRSIPFCLKWQYHRFWGFVLGDRGLPACEGSDSLPYLILGKAWERTGDRWGYGLGVGGWAGHNGTSGRMAVKENRGEYYPWSQTGEWGFG